MDEDDDFIAIFVYISKFQQIIARVSGGIINKNKWIPVCTIQHDNIIMTIMDDFACSE